MSNSSGQLVGEVTRYTPFGAYRGGGPNDITDRGFTGQKENMELGLYYYNARYYVPGIGRFASADTIVPNSTNPQSFNRYSYVFNRPTYYDDPSGNCPWCLPGALIGGAIGGAFTGGTYLLTHGDDFNTTDFLLATGTGVVGGALIGTGVGAVSGAAILSSSAATAATVAIGAGTGTVVSSEIYMFTTDQFDRTDFTIFAAGGGIEGGLTAAVPGSGIGPALGRAATSSIIAGGEQIAGDIAHNTASPGILKTMTLGFASGVFGEMISGGFKGRNAAQLPLELPPLPEIQPTQWLDPLVNGRELQQSMVNQSRSILRTIGRDTAYGTLADKLLPQ